MTVAKLIQKVVSIRKVSHLSICGFEGMYQSFQYSSIAQSVEQTAVNRWVVGSSPTRGVF